MRNLILSCTLAGAFIGLVACTQPERVASLAAAESLIAGYNSTPNPNAAVQAQLTKLDAAAKAAVAASGAGSQPATDAIEALIAYLGTAAPGAPGLTAAPVTG